MSTQKVKQLAIVRACLYGAKLDTKQINSPMVAIIYSQNEICPGHMHLDLLAEAVRRGIESEGGTGIKINAGVGVCDGIAMGHEGMKYSLPSREINRDAAINMIKAHGVFDGIVFIGACDKNLPGYLMAAAALADLPSVFVTSGAMLKPSTMKSGSNKVISSDEVLYEKGEISKEDFEQAIFSDCPTIGTCYGMFSANSMACVTEVLGLSISGMATSNAVENKKYRLCTESGRRIMHLIKHKMNTRMILTEQAFSNAIKVAVAIGASTNVMLHIPAIAKEMGYNFDLQNIKRISHDVPNILQLAPANDYSITDFDQVGGLLVVMNRLKNLLNLEVETVAGKLKDIIANVHDHNDVSMIKTLEKPYSRDGGITIYSGNLAPEGAVFKESAVALSVSRRFVGTAKVFNCEEDALVYIQGNKLSKGDIVVIRYEGLAGGPGMREMLYATSTIVGLKMDADVAVITDGRFSGATSGICIGHIQPEAYLGGPIALLQDGDKIEIDRDKQEINVLIAEEELGRRRNTFVRVEKPANTKLLENFRKAHMDAKV